MRVYGYARVSSEEQAANGHSLQDQVNRLKTAGCSEVFADVDSAYINSGDRPQLNRLLEKIQSNEVDRLLITSLDRLSRNETLAFTIFDQLDKHGVRLTALDQPYLDLSHPDGRRMAGYSIVDARAYSANLSKRVRQGHKAHRDRNAAYFAPFGYQVVDERYELDLEPFLCLLEDRKERSKAAIAREIVELFLEAKSLRKTLVRLNSRYGIATRSHQGSGNRQARGRLAFHASGLGSWLNNPILRGHTAYGRSYRQRQKHKDSWDIRLNTHPAHVVMSELEYAQVEAILDYNAEHGGFSFASETIHPLSGLIYCGECGGRCRITSFSLRTDRSIKRYSYQCNNYHYRSCTQKPSIREEVLESALIEALTSRAEQVAQQTKTPPGLAEPIALQDLRRQLRILEGLGENSAIIAAREDLRRQIEQMSRATAQEEESKHLRHEELVRIFGKADFWGRLTSEERQKAYRWLVYRLWMRGGEIERIELRC